ncbi:MAG: dipZ [Firmicutes bacterium]|nr:dipZ [Bacillota bacterium]
MDQMSLSYLTVFIAGIASLFSPCVLPLLPTYLAFLGGNSNTPNQQTTSRLRLLVNTSFFLIGFTTAFILMGASASYLGQLFLNYHSVIRKFGAVFIILMGLQLSGLLPLPILYQERRPLLKYTFQGPFGAFILGIALTAGWTPCIGPILATILMYAGTETTINQGALLLFVYALGFCLPFLAIAAFCNQLLKHLSLFYSWLPLIQRVSGVVIILSGLAIYFDIMNKFLAFLLSLS